MSRLSYFLFMLSLVGAKLQAAPVVLVEHQGDYKGYFESPRLGLVVSQMNTSASLYWPAAKLFKVDVDTKLKLEQQRQQLLLLLKQLKQEFQQEGDSALVTSVSKLETDVAAWELAGNMNLPLDPDSVRTKPTQNPLLLAGQYKLVVNNRPTELAIEGLVAEHRTALLNATSIDKYLDTISLLDGASGSFIYVIPAAGHFYKAKTGLWNKQHQEVLPGTVLFIPFEERHLPSAFSDINEQIVELLLHKVVVQ